MCSFATRNDTEFSLAMARFVAAQAGCIVARPGRHHFDLSVSASHAAETRAAAGGSPGLPIPAAATAFNLDACFEIAPLLDLPDRIGPIARPA